MTRPFAKRVLTGALATTMFMLTAAGTAFGQSAEAGQPSWELRVCPAPNTMPFSNDDETGFENRIAELLAEELNASLTYLWHAYNADLINREFAEGNCDVLMGVSDGFESGLNTISYYQSPYVHVYRADSGLEIESMDDPVLQELTFAVQGVATPPHEALLARGLTGNVKLVFGNEEGSDRLGRMIDAVADGTVDVGFGWGPVVSYYAARHEADLVVTPIEPIFDLPAIFQIQPMTLAVRTGDYALQQRLNRAIAARWDGINAVLEEFNVPIVPSPAPVVGPLPDDSRNLRIGVVLPIPTGARTYDAGIYNLIGDAARQGALMAESIASRSQAAGEIDVTLLLSSSPSAEAAERGAAAMTALGEVDAIIGGVGSGQAEAIARIIGEAGLPFINIGDPGIALREQCFPTTFHVQASAVTYLQAMVDLYGVQDGPTSWFIVHEDDAESQLKVEALEHLIGEAGDELVGSRVVEKYRPVYHDIFAEAEELGAHTLIVLLDPPDQLALIGQAEDAGFDLEMAPFPDPLTQTREFLAASKKYGAGVGVPRLQLWDPTLDSERAARINEQFVGQWGLPFDAPAWAAFEAVTVLTAATRTADSIEPELLAGALFDVDAGELGGKESGLFFNEVNRELNQELYLVEVNAENEWGIRPSRQLGAGTLLQTWSPGESVNDYGCQ